MENFWTAISVIGSIASLYGAYLAYEQYRKSANAAEIAENAKNEIINHRKIGEIFSLQKDTERILNKVAQVGPASTEKSLMGVDCEVIASEVEQYCRSIRENLTHFDNKFGNKAEQLCTDLMENIEKLSEADNFRDKKDAGKRIYFKISSFQPIIKNMADKKIEATAS